MSSTRRVSLAVAALLALADLAAHGAPAAPAPTVVAKASKTDVSVGEAFTLELEASGPEGCTFAFPPALDDETIELAALPATAPLRAQRYRATVFAVGDAQVPPIPVRYRMPDGSAGELHTAAIPLHVVSLLPKAKDEQKLADVHPPVALAVGRAFWIGLATLLALLAALVWWLVRRRRATVLAPAPAVPAIEPDVEARQALTALAASGRLDRAEFRPFYIELTVIAKRYLERRLDAPIVEMTTSEMLVHLRTNPYGMDMTPLLRDLSGAADRIKFACGSGLVEDAERHLAETRALVDGLEARLTPPSGNGTPAGGDAPSASEAA